MKDRVELEAYLIEASGDNIKFRANIESPLLADEGKSIIDKPILPADVTPDISPLTEIPGMMIGRYKLLEKIGEGGMARWRSPGGRRR